MGCFHSRIAKCCICFEKNVNKVLFPCGHRILCDNCIEKLYISAEANIHISFPHLKYINCPLCRKISVPIQIYE